MGAIVFFVLYKVFQVCELGITSSKEQIQGEITISPTCENILFDLLVNWISQQVRYDASNAQVSEF